MLTWLLASGGTNRLAVTYFVIAALALVVALSAAALGHHSAAGQETLQLHITRYHG